MKNTFLFICVLITLSFSQSETCEDGQVESQDPWDQTFNCTHLFDWCDASNFPTEISFWGDPNAKKIGKPIVFDEVCRLTAEGTASWPRNPAWELFDKNLDSDDQAKMNISDPFIMLAKYLQKDLLVQ